MNQPRKQPVPKGGVPLGHQVIAQKQSTYLNAIKHLTAAAPTPFKGQALCTEGVMALQSSPTRIAQQNCLLSIRLSHSTSTSATEQMKGS
jgi:hypothetical protein